MNIQHAESLALDAIHDHLFDVGLEYSFKWSNALRVFGTCNIKHKTITLSRPLTELNTIDIVNNTILHEIAHALAYEFYRDRGHGRDWRAIAADIGCDAQRCYKTSEVKTPPRRWLATCPSCGNQTKAHRRTSYACGKCCREYNSGRYSEQYAVQWSINPEYKQ